MKRIGLLLACCLLLGACTVVDAGVGRGASAWTTQFGADGYMSYGWPANEDLLSVDFIGGADPYTLVSADVWRLLHLEIGLLGAGIGIGPLQIGGGLGLYAPHAPASIKGNNPFNK